MNAKRVNTAAGVIARAMDNGYVTPAGWATALESAQLLQSPEMAHRMAELEAERDALRARVDEVERAYTFDTAGLKRERDALQRRLHDAAMVKVWKNEDGKRFVFVEDLAPALLGLEPEGAPVDGISRRIAPTQALRNDACSACGSLPEEWCPDCAACRKGCYGGNEGNPCTHPNAPWVKREVVAPQGEHYAAVHHEYRVPRDLPQVGGAS